MTNHHVLIIGGGIAGPALALFLDRAGIASTIYEAYPQVGDLGGGLQIAPNGMHVLTQLGIAEQLESKGVEGVNLSLENQSGKLLGCITNSDPVKYGAPAVQMSRSLLHKTLMQEVDKRRIPVIYQKRLKDLSFRKEGVVAHFADGSTSEGSLLVGADGIHSQTRQILFPLGPHPFYTGLLTIGGFSSHAALKPAAPSGARTSHMIFGRNGFFGYGYYDEEKPDSVMWWSHLRRENETPRADHSASTDELRQDLLEHHKGWHQPVEMILRNATELLTGPVYDVASLPTWWKDRAILIGDAAHATSPHAGQGASLALEDAMYLAKMLRNPSIAHRDAFENFTRERRNRVERIVAEARRRGNNKKELSPAASWMRDRAISIYTRVSGNRMNDWMYSYKIAWDT